MACNRSEGLGAAHLADDDTLRSHAQAVAYQAAHRDFSLAFDVRWTGLQAHDVRLLKLQLGGVLAGDDALVLIDIPGQAIQQRRLAGTGTAGDDDVAAHPADDLEYLGAFCRDCAKLDELVESELVLLELTDGKGSTIDRKGATR